LNALTAQNCIQFFPLGNITTISEDSSSLWLGSAQNGLIQFDKLTLTAQYWNTTNSNIASNSIDAIIHHNDKLYVSSDSGLLYFDNQNFTMVNDSINGLLVEMNNGNLAVVDVEHVYLLQNDSIIYHQNLDSIPDVNGDCCYFNTEALVDSSGNLWITRYAFYEFDILKFDGNTWTTFHSGNTPALPIESYSFNGLANRSDTIYSYSWGGVVEHIQGIWTLKFPWIDIVNFQDTVHGHLSTGAINVDDDGAIWLGMSNETPIPKSGQLLYYNNNSKVYLPIVDSVASIITKIHFSSFDSDIVYAASNTGLIIVEKSCLALSNRKVTPNELSAQIKIFPNPASSVIYIEAKDIDIQRMELYDVTGRKLKSSFSQLELNIEDVPTGNYFLQIVSDKGSVMKKVVIQR